MNGMSQNELEILIKIKAELEDLIKVKKGMGDLAEKTKEVGKKADTSLRGMQTELRNLLSPLTMIRRTWFQLGVAWSLTAGLIVGAVVNIRNEIQKLDDISMKTGFSVEEISTKMYGFNVSTKEAQAGVLALNQTQNMLARTWMFLTTKVTEFVGVQKIVGEEAKILQEELNKVPVTGWQKFVVGLGKMFMGDKYALAVAPETMKEQAKKQAQERIDLTRWEENSKKDTTILLQGELKSKIAALQGNSLQSFKEIMNATKKVYENNFGPSGEVTQLFIKFYELQEEKMQLSKLGLIETWEIMEQRTKEVYSAMGNSATTFFSDVLKGQMKSMKDYFAMILDNMIDLWVKAQIQMAMTAYANSQIGGGGIWSNIWAGVSAFVGSGGSGSGVGHQHGGWVGQSGPELALVGEAGPEYVTPAHQIKDETGGEATSIHYYINAVDAASFATLVSRNPEVILDITSKAIQRNQSLRRVIRKYT